MIRSLTLFAAALCLPSWAMAQSAPVDEAARLAEFRTFAKTYRDKNRVLSFSWAIARGDRIIAAEGIGWQDHDAEEKTSADTTYLVASITKTFTAATLIAMDADGIIDLDDEFAKLSDWKGRCDWLAGSGNIFGGGKPLDDGYTPPKIDCAAKLTLRNVLQMRVLGKPGTNFLYNPIVFGRLANWVEEQTGKPFDHWVRRYVIDKARIKDVAAGWRDTKGGLALVNLAPPFKFVAPEVDEDRLQPSPLPNPEMNASSGIIASVRGLAAYSIALDQGRILPRKSLDLMWTPPVDADGREASYAYGWWTQRWRGQRLVWHGGWWPDAYAGLLLKVPEKKLTLVLQGNTDGLNWQNRLQVAEVEKSPLALKFLELFAAEGSERSDALDRRRG